MTNLDHNDVDIPIFFKLTIVFFLNIKKKLTMLRVHLVLQKNYIVPLFKLLVILT